MQVCSIVSLAPSLAHTLTFRPSQRRERAVHTLFTGGLLSSTDLPGFFELPPQATASSPTPTSAHTAFPRLVPIAILSRPNTTRLVPVGRVSRVKNRSRGSARPQPRLRAPRARLALSLSAVLR